MTDFWKDVTKAEIIQLLSKVVLTDLLTEKQCELHDRALRLILDL